ncbi:MAG: putative glycoside hydrolase, partial [Patescibacteria group bacterium]
MSFKNTYKSVFKNQLVILLVFLFIIFVIIYFVIPLFIYTKYNTNDIAGVSIDKEVKKTEPQKKVFIATHVKTPEQVKAIYMTSWVAGTPSMRKKIIDIIDRTEINSVVIDIKDYTGKISFEIEDLALKEVGSSENRISDIKEFIKILHDKNIYVIGRISVFQDPQLVSKHPELAVKKASDGSVWKDHKGISWLDAGAKQVWDYVINIGKESYRIGFDELNFDYIRFPSDGNMNDIYYPFSEQKILADPELGKAKVIEEFFKYLSNKLRETEATLSADLFGMVTTNSDDLNIGQVLERALPYFDYVAPMVYPSHYPKTFIGFSNPSAHPYEVVKHSMDFAVKRAVDLDNIGIATTSPMFDKITSKSVKKLRPWLQDFDLGATYTAEMVRKQIQATYDSGLTSWMLWDAANTYT